MNIFYLDKDIRKCAQYHCDKHVLKMLVEYTQILCTAINETGGDAPYKSTHINHPSNKWARESKKNWKYLQSLTILLHEEYKERYGKNHRSGLLAETLSCPKLPKGKFTEPPQCVPEDCKQKSTVMAYRQYYIKEKSRFALWKTGKIPKWYSVGLAISSIDNTVKVKAKKLLRKVIR